MRCRTCGVDRQPGDFLPHPAAPGGVLPDCRDCLRAFLGDAYAAKLTPGPQPHNQVAGSAAEQILRAAGLAAPRPPPRAEAERLAALLAAHPDVLAPALAPLVADLVAEAMTSILAPRNGNGRVRPRIDPPVNGGAAG